MLQLLIGPLLYATMVVLVIVPLPNSALSIVWKEGLRTLVTLNVYVLLDCSPVGMFTIIILPLIELLL
jgi:hypothetical protein